MSLIEVRHETLLPPLDQDARDNARTGSGFDVRTWAQFEPMCRWGRMPGVDALSALDQLPAAQCAAVRKAAGLDRPRNVPVKQSLVVLQAQQSLGDDKVAKLTFTSSAIICAGEGR